MVISSCNTAEIANRMGNKDITGETNGNFNAGVDLEMFKNRFSGSVEFFHRKTTDVVFSFPLPPSFGFSSYYANVGDMRNQGIEMEFNGTPIRTNDLTWDLRFNMTYYKNKITYLPEQRKTMKTPDGTEGYASGSYFYGEGIPMYTFYMQKYAGVDENGVSQFYKEVSSTDENGEKVTTIEKTTNYSDATNYLCGTALPKVYGGFGTSLNYKGLDFSIDFVYQLGGQVYDSSYAGMMGNPRSSNRGQVFHADLLNEIGRAHV